MTQGTPGAENTVNSLWGGQGAVPEEKVLVLDLEDEEALEAETVGRAFQAEETVCEQQERLAVREKGRVVW